MNHPGTRALFDYWTQLRLGAETPYKSQVTAQGVGAALVGSAFILESLGRGNVRFRLAGSKLHDLFGLEIRGMSALSIMDAASRDRFQAMIEESLSAPSVSVARCVAAAPDGAGFEIEIAILPLRSDYGQTNRAIGAAHVLGDEAALTAAPRRCRIVEAATLPIGASPAREMAETQTPFTGGPAPLRAIEGGAAGVATGRRRGHLRLVKE